MCRKLMIAALFALIAPAVVAAGEPVITYQTQPLGRMLNDMRVFVRNVAGEEGVKSVNKDIERSLGKKGFAGFDLARPILGYIDIPSDPSDFVAVVAFPVAGEADWLDFCERWNKSKPKAIKDGLYEVPAPNGNLKAVMKFHEGYAFVATGAKDPARALDAKTIINPVNLTDGEVNSYMSGKLHFDRLPKELRGQAKSALDIVKKMHDARKDENVERLFEKAVVTEFHKLATKWIDLSEGATLAALRINVDAFNGEATAELTITPKPGSPLEKAIEGYKFKENRFGSLVTPDAAAAIRLRLPLDIPEVQATAVAGLELLQKEANNNAFPPVKPVIDELLKSFIRTAKTGEADGVAVLRGPNKDGHFHAVAVLSADDPSAFEKELKKFVDGIAPEDFKQALKWDAEKINGVNVHTIDLSKMPGGDREIQAVFGKNALVAFAFGPKAAYGAIGPGAEAVAAIKGAMEAKPAASPMLDFAINPERVLKMVNAIEPQAGQMAVKILGPGNTLKTKLGLEATGGKELKVKMTLNPQVFMSWIGFRASSTFEQVEPPMELKK